MTIPNEINSMIISPIIKLYSPEWKIMNKELENFKDEIILKNLNKYFDILAKNIDWLLNLDEKYKLEEYFYTTYPNQNQYKIFFREYHRLIRLIALLKN